MLVVTSNWALGDGTLVPSAASWHGVLPAAIHRGVIRAGFREDGSYRPVDVVDLVLAGDTFDWLSSAAWGADVKPWQGGAAAREAAVKVAHRSIRGGRRLLAPLAAWARSGMPVPAAARGRPGRGSVTVAVRVTLLAGDRDAAVEEHVGRRSGRPPFTVGSCWDDGRIAIRHGHEFDPSGLPAGRAGAGHDREPTLAESIAVDLVGRFAVGVARDVPGADRLVRLLAGAGPAGIPAAVAAWKAAPETRLGAGSGDLAERWRRCTDAWWRDARRSVPSSEVEFDVVDAVAEWYADAWSPEPRTPAGIERLRPRPPRASPGQVFGHLGPRATTSAVCLGIDPAAMESMVPAVITCTEPSGWPRWRSLLPAVERTAVVSIRTAGRQTPGDDRIVDAA